MAKKNTEGKKAAKYIIIENGRLFSEFLNKVSMNGKIPEVLLTIEEGGHVSSNSVDVTQTMFSMCSCYVGESNIEDQLSIGIPQINILAKKLSTDQKYKIIIGEDMIAVTCKGKKGALKFRTIPEEDISTALQEDINEDSLELDSKLHFSLKGEKVEELQEYISLTTCSAVIFEIQKGKLFAMSPDTDTVQFKLYMCKVDEDSMRVAVYAEPLDRMLNLLKGMPVSFYIGSDNPLVLEQEGQYWGIGNIDE